MTADMNKLSPSALAAAMRGGTDEWGHHATLIRHVRYTEPVATTSRRRCHCGCKQRATHLGMTSGLAMTQGCELSIYRWICAGH